MINRQFYIYIPVLITFFLFSSYDISFSQNRKCNFEITKADITKVRRGEIFISNTSNGTACYKNIDGRIIYYPIKNGRIEGNAYLYYYEDVIETITPYKNNKKHGIEKRFYPSGAILTETPYKNDKIDGLLKEYYEQGQLHFYIPYKNGKAEGVRKDYYVDGSLKAVFNYKNDFKHGKVITYFILCLKLSKV